MFWRKWDEWPCTHACTAFFSIAYDLVEGFVPKPLVAKRDKDGRGEIELGYVRLPSSHGLPDSEEMAWAIAVERVHGSGLGMDMAFTQ
jgi:hypothetical protein